MASKKITHIILIFFHTVLQAHKTIVSGKPPLLHKNISTHHPRNTRGAAAGLIRYGESFRRDSSLITATFKHRAVQMYNTVPVSVRTGSLETVKTKLKKWIRVNVPIDWG